MNVSTVKDTVILIVSILLVHLQDYYNIILNIHLAIAVDAPEDSIPIGYKDIATLIDGFYYV